LNQKYFWKTFCSNKNFITLNIKYLKNKIENFEKIMAKIFFTLIKLLYHCDAKNEKIAQR